MNNEFQREDRYIVIKRSDMDKAPTDLVRSFSVQCRKLHDSMLTAGAPARSYLVIESDWPEHDPAWQMIEQRVIGVFGGLPEVVAVINEEGEHFKETVVEHRPGIDRLPVGTELIDRAHFTRLQAEISALRGLTPALPPRPPEGHGLPRYGLRWNGPSQPLAVPMEDGYWTPWHLADQLRTKNTDGQEINP